MTRAAVIAGTGQTAHGSLPDHSSLELHALAAAEALSEAGLGPSDVEGLVTAGSRTQPYLMHSVSVGEYLGIRPRFGSTMSLGGASHCAAVWEAAQAIRRGEIQNCLIVAADNLKTGTTRAATEVLAATGAGHPEFELPFGPTIPSLYALIASRYDHVHGDSTAARARVAVEIRRFATRNPLATLRSELADEDVLGSPFISTPLRKLECAVVSDGGGAVLLRAVDRPAPGDAVVLGGGVSLLAEHVSALPDLLDTGIRESATLAFSAADCTPQDIDIAYLYDSFTIAVLLQLEGAGFCGAGEARDFVLDGGLGASGTLPLNTHGGLLSHGHPGKSGGIVHIVEAVRQLRGQADVRVGDPELAYIHGSGGALSTHASLILGRA